MSDLFPAGPAPVLPGYRARPPGGDGKPPRIRAAGESCRACRHFNRDTTDACRGLCDADLFDPQGALFARRKPVTIHDWCERHARRVEHD